MDKVGIVGLGRLGAALAQRLGEGGYRVTALFDHRPEAARAVAGELRALVCPSLAEVSAQADVVLVALPHEAAYREIFLGRGDTLLRKAKGRIFVLCGGGCPPALAERIDEAATEAKAQLVALACLGTLRQARQGTLVLGAAGKRKVLERLKPIFALLGTFQKPLPRVGDATRLQALGTLASAAQLLVLAEVLALARAQGLDATLVRELLARTGAASRALDEYGPALQLREAQAGQPAEHIARDVAQALGLAREKGLQLAVAEAVQGTLLQLVDYTGKPPGEGPSGPPPDLTAVTELPALRARAAQRRTPLPVRPVSAPEATPSAPDEGKGPAAPSTGGGMWARP